MAQGIADGRGAVTRTLLAAFRFKPVWLACSVAFSAASFILLAFPTAVSEVLSVFSAPCDAGDGPLGNVDDVFGMCSSAADFMGIA